VRYISNTSATIITIKEVMCRPQASSSLTRTTNNGLEGLWFSSLSELYEWADGAPEEVQRIRYRESSNTGRIYWESFGGRAGALGTQVRDDGCQVDIQTSDMSSLSHALEMLADFYAAP
jgi:hypothetical protein